MSPRCSHVTTWAATASSRNCVKLLLSSRLETNGNRGQFLSSPSCELILWRLPSELHHRHFDPQMQRVTFPVSFPAYAYKVAADSESGHAFRYGVLASDLVQLTPELSTLIDLAEYVVSELLHLHPLPATEEVPDEYSDLSDEDWLQLNLNIKLRSSHLHQASRVQVGKSGRSR